MAYNRTTPPPPMINGIIDHELPSDTHNTYDVIFFGESIHTTVACDPIPVTQWISETESANRHCLNNLIVGLDLEWRPSYQKYVTNPVATIQLCVGRRCLIFQLIHSPSIPNSLIEFLRNPNYKFVGIGVKQDLEKLEEDYEIGFNTNTVDLREVAAAKYGRRDLKNSGLKTLAGLVMEKEVDKPKSVTMSRWDNMWLTPSQVRYACVDAYLSFEIGRILMDSSPSSISGSGSSAPRSGSGSSAPRSGSGSSAPRHGSGSSAPRHGSGSSAPRYGSGSAPRYGSGSAPRYGSGSSAPRSGSRSGSGSGSSAPRYGSGSAPHYGSGSSAPPYGSGSSAPWYG